MHMKDTKDIYTRLPFRLSIKLFFISLSLIVVTSLYGTAIMILCGLMLFGKPLISFLGFLVIAGLVTINYFVLKALLIEEIDDAK